MVIKGNCSLPSPSDIVDKNMMAVNARFERQSRWLEGCNENHQVNTNTKPPAL